MSDKSPMFTPPVPFREMIFHRHTLRSIGWLELYYDLIYVATFIQIGNFLSKHVEWGGFGQFLLLIAVTWWSWSGTTLFYNRFVADDWLHRVLVFMQMSSVAVLGISVSHAFTDLYLQFTLAYVLTRLVLVLMYLRMARVHRETAQFSIDYAVAFGVGAGLWLGSLFLPSEYRWIAWAVAILVEFLLPNLPHMLAHQKLVSLDPHHLEERLGIFTIIVLGEAFVKVLDSAQGTAFSVDQFWYSVFGLAVTFGLWWLYFTDTMDHGVEVEKPGQLRLWFYGHLPLAAGLVTFAVAAKKLYGATLEHPGEALPTEYRLLYAGGLALYLAALVLIDTGTHHGNRQADNIQLATRVLSIVAIIILGIFAVEFDAVRLVMNFAVIFLFQIGVSLWLHTRKNYATPHYHHE